MGKLWEEIQSKASSYLSEMDERDALNEGKLLVEAEEDQPVEDDTIDEISDEPVDEEPVDEPAEEDTADEPAEEEEPASDEESVADALEDVAGEDITTKDVAKAVKTLAAHLSKSEKKINGINFNKLSFAKQNEVLSALQNVYAKAKELAAEMDSFNGLSWK